MIKKILFVYTRPHPVHKDFIDSLEPKYKVVRVPNGIYKYLHNKYLELFRSLFNPLISFVKSIFLNANFDYLISENGYCIWLSYFIKIKNPNIKWIYMSTDELLFKLNKNPPKLFNGIYSFLLKKVDSILVVHGSFNLLSNKKQKSICLNKPYKITCPHFDLKPLTTPKKNFGSNFLFIGRLTKEKNILRTINLFLDIEKKGIDFSFNIVGDGPLRKQVLAKIKKSKKIHFRGYSNQIVNWLKKSDYLILLSTYDSFAIVVLEAMSQKVLPIVSSNVGSSNLLKENFILNLHDSDYKLRGYILNILNMGNSNKKEIIYNNLQISKRFIKSNSISIFKKKFIELTHLMS